MIKLNQFLTIAALFAISACGTKTGINDASGTFEATEVIVSSEASGKILAFNVQEGQKLEANNQVGYIDSLQIYLRKRQLLANVKAVTSRRPDIAIQIAATQQQIATAMGEKKRVENLVKANAANQKQLDDINAQIALFQKQLEAQRSTLEISNRGITEESSVIQIQVAQLEDQLQKCKIVSPITGTVLVKYAETGELAAPGKPLFKIADTELMTLRAYITSSQLTQLKLGQEVKVNADSGEKESRQYSGKITWVSDRSEFTPKTIQTKDERANLVYAIKVAVKNDGYLKIGMYGNIQLASDK
jgi:HlyD family secretion protein